MAQTENRPVIDAGAFGDDAPIVQGELEDGLAVDPARAQINRLRSLEDNLLERSMRIIDSALSFEEIEDPSGQAEAEPPVVKMQSDGSVDLQRADIPLEWIQELGYEKALRRLRVARAAWRGAKDAPVGLKMATAVFNGIVKARATEKATPTQINIIAVPMSAPLPDFPRRKLPPNE